MKLSVFQSLWAMEQLPYLGTEWTLAEKIAKISDAGFDGVDVAWSPTLPCGPEAIQRAWHAGLGVSIVCFPTSVEDLKPIMERFAGSAVRQINIQPMPRPATVLEAIPYVLGWLDIAQKAGVNVVFETHRDRMTTSLPFTLQLIDAIPSMMLAADLSHYLLGEEFAWPVSEENQAAVRRILSRSNSFHGRVASREQVQIPISFGYHKQWVDLFAGWWQEGFTLWRDRAAPDDELIFVSELGPPLWYAITGADGAELSDRWEEALMMKELVHGLWDRASTAGGQSQEVLL